MYLHTHTHISFNYILSFCSLMEVGWGGGVYWLKSDPDSGY